jgi:general nucleoside transport system ATP-binding protein
MMRYFVELRDAGVAVVVISEELEELLNISDRIAVMFHGEIMGIVDTASTDIEAIGMLMGGGRAATPSLEQAGI